MDEARQFENHHVACMATLGGGGQVTRMGGAVVLAHPRLSLVMANMIALREADPAGLPNLLQVASAILAGYGRRPALLLSPAAGDVTALSDALEMLAWRRVERQVVLACPLPHPGSWAPDEVSVDELTPDSLAIWGRVLVKGYEASAAVGSQIRAAWTTLMDNPLVGCTVRYYLAQIAGRPVGTGLSWMQGGVAGLYCGAVLPRYRRRGVERATLLRRLSVAAASGASIAIVQTAAGSPVEHLCVDRLGFRRAYCRDLWLPGSERSPQLS